VEQILNLWLEEIKDQKTPHNNKNKMILFVDKLFPHEIGGLTRDINKIKFNLVKVNIKQTELLNSLPKNDAIPTTMFEAGKYICIFQYNKELTEGSMAFFNYEIDLEKNFDSFADTLTPKVVGQFHEMQKRIGQSNLQNLNSVHLSNDWQLIQN